MTGGHVLIFDSGIGGLSIAATIKQRLPTIKLSYLADSANFPYGEHSDDFLVNTVVRLVENAINRLQPDIVVIACNTASTIALAALRASLSTPVVGVVPAIKPAAELSKTKHIGLLATPATIQRPYIDKLIEDFAPGCNIYRIGSTELVGLAETPTIDLEQRLHKILAPWLATDLAHKIDTIVLGCTHFPLIKPAIQHCVGSHIRLIDSSDAIANRVQDLLKERAITSHSDNATDCAYFTNIETITDKTRQTLQQYGLGIIKPC